MTEGSVTREFEKNFADYVGAEYGIATTSCTTSLELALRVLGIGAGDEVIAPDFTYPITAGVAVLVGAEPVLVDVDLESRNVTADRIEKAMTEKTGCIVPVSEFGNPLKLEVYELAEEYGVPLVEDAACAAGAEINDTKVGTFADLSCFSFHPRKVITTGEGGIITTNSKELAEKVKSLKRFGIEDGEFRYWGTNSKLSNIQGAIGLVQLNKIEDIIEMRIKRARRYDDLLENIDGVTSPKVRENVRHTFQSYTVYVENGLRDELRVYLSEEGIETQIGTYALHLEPCFSGVKKIGSLENSEKLYRNLLTLPMYYEMTDEEQDRVCHEISNFMSKKVD